MDTFINDVSTTRTNIAIARRIARGWSPPGSAGVAPSASAFIAGYLLTSRIATTGRLKPFS
jgi:hypothetical protein